MYEGATQKSSKASNDDPQKDSTGHWGASKNETEISHPVRPSIVNPCFFTRL